MKVLKTCNFFLNVNNADYDSGTQELHVEFISCDDMIKLNYYNKLCYSFFCIALTITRL